MNDQVINILQKKWVVPTVVGVISFSTGGGIGYILGKRKTQDPKVEQVVEDNQLAFDFDENELATVFDAVKYRATRDSVIAEEAYSEYELEDDAELAIEEDELEDAEEIDNVFSGSDEEWDYEAELSARSAEAPYVIHVDEFVADEMGLRQSTFTYYQGDDIMADEHDTPVYNYPSIMGELKFGHGSKDSSAVYIRNERIRLEWEVLLHNGRFEVEVLGHQIEDRYEEQELRHSVQRFRDE